MLINLFFLLFLLIGVFIAIGVDHLAIIYGFPSGGRTWWEISLLLDAVAGLCALISLEKL